jgi:hypothetical protein
MMEGMRPFLFAIVLFKIGLGIPPGWARDFGQCDRRCAEEFGAGHISHSKKLDRLTCECFHEKLSLGKID